VFEAEEIERLKTELRDPSKAIVRSAMQRLAERQAEEDRPLCPSCTKRRVNRGASLCTPCQEQHELQLAHKRKWWNAHGTERKKARAAASAEMVNNNG